MNLHIVDLVAGEALALFTQQRNSLMTKKQCCCVILMLVLVSADTTIK